MKWPNIPLLVWPLTCESLHNAMLYTYLYIIRIQKSGLHKSTVLLDLNYHQSKIIINFVSIFELFNALVRTVSVLKI